LTRHARYANWQAGWHQIKICGIARPLRREVNHGRTFFTGRSPCISRLARHGVEPDLDKRLAWGGSTFSAFNGDEIGR
jgi:hypothetical protein